MTRRARIKAKAKKLGRRYSRLRVRDTYRIAIANDKDVQRILASKQSVSI